MWFNSGVNACSSFHRGTHSIRQTGFRHPWEKPYSCYNCGTSFSVARRSVCSYIWQRISDWTVFPASTATSYLVCPVMPGHTGDCILMKSLPSLWQLFVTCPLLRHHSRLSAMTMVLSGLIWMTIKLAWHNNWAATEIDCCTTVLVLTFSWRKVTLTLSNQLTASWLVFLVVTRVQSDTVTSPQNLADWALHYGYG